MAVMQLICFIGQNVIAVFNTLNLLKFPEQDRNNMSNLRHSYYLFLAFTILAAGCSAFTPPIQRPVIEDKLGPSFWTKRENVGTLSLTPERRVVLVNFFNQRFCAEAPTEVGLDFSSIVNASGSANVANRGELALGLLIGSSGSNSVLNKRSQAVQLFLANSYYGCQMYMNGAISGEQLVKLQLETMTRILPVLEKEISVLYSPAAGTVPPVNYVPLDVNKYVEELFGKNVKSSEDEQKEKPKEQNRKEP